ncbi:alpha/beta fold hydrolase [Psychrobacter aquaticus]|uniref:Alpha/beta hydrolase fold n=1 Tax=Psychrobacter aquaticus CMS 56 TaxID=1354303 RepID=U4TEH4_9GAMM|nr:alpha/beta hydrolase [Psychrobacter aquaticus]ERL56868.1 Alpha/beta hydrolase fold [Psychrobacter aquaticus CMS 56]
MKINLLSLPRHYQLQTLNVALADGTLLPVSVIGNGQPVMILHAYGMDAREFLPFILPLIDKYEFYLPHFRGFGAAKDIKLTQFDFVRQYADDVNTVIEKICMTRHVESLPVAAISMGALVMWAYFERFGTSRVSRYMNIDQSPVIHNQVDWQGGLFGKQQQEMFDIFHEVVDMTLPYAKLDSFTHLPFALKRRVTDVERLFSLLSVNRPRSKAIVQILTHQKDHKLVFYDHSTWQHKMRCLQAYLALPYDFRTIIEDVTIPVVNLIGGRSKLYDPIWQQKITQMLPNAHEIVLPRSGHAVPLDEPIRFYKVLKDFLDNKV